MRNLILALAISIFTISSAMADQLIIKETYGRGGAAYVVNIYGTNACFKAAENLSNLKQHSNPIYATIRNFYKISFICMKENGTITSHGNLYQLPYSPTGKLCVDWGPMGGYSFNTDACDKANFKTRAVNVPGGQLTLRRYVNEHSK